MKKLKYSASDERKKFITGFKILILVISLGLVVKLTTLNYSGLFFKQPKQVADVISGLSKSFQTDIIVSSNTGVLKGTFKKNKKDVEIEVIEPQLLMGTKLIYNPSGVTVKYKEIEYKTEENELMKKFPITVILDVENMVYNGAYNTSNIKDDILLVEGKYGSSHFTFKANLRQNRVVSICLEGENIYADLDPRL